MTSQTLKFRCQNCSRKYSVESDNLPKFADRRFPCRDCRTPLRVPLELAKGSKGASGAVPHDQIAELPEAKPTIGDRVWDCVVWFRDWLMAEGHPGRRWVTGIVVFLVAYVAYGEYKDWQASRRAVERRLEVIRENHRLTERQQARQQTPRPATQASNEEPKPQANRRPALLFSGSHPIGVNAMGDSQDRQSESSDEPTLNEGDLFDPTSATSVNPPTVVNVDDDQLSFQNGAATLIDHRGIKGWVSSRGIVSLPDPQNGVGLVVAHGGAGGHVSIYDPNEGRHIRTLETELGGSHPLLLSPNGRFLAANSTANDIRKVRMSLFDLHENKLLLKEFSEALCFSGDGNRLAVRRPDADPVVLDLAEVDAGGSDAIRAIPILNYKSINDSGAVDFMTAAVFLTPDVIAYGTDGGTIGIAEVGKRLIHDQTNIGRRIKRIYAPTGTNKLFVEAGWADSPGLTMGNLGVAWFEYTLDEKDDRLRAHLKYKAQKFGDQVVVSEASRQFAVIEKFPTGSGKTAHAAVCIYDLLEPNKLLRVFSKPLRLQYLCSFSHDGRYVYGAGPHETAVVIDVQGAKAYSIGQEEFFDTPTVGNETKFVVHPINDERFATISIFGKTMLYRIADCLQHAEELNPETGIPKDVLRQLSKTTRGWKLNGFFTQAGAVTAYSNGRIKLAVEGGAPVIPIPWLTEADQQYLAWVVGGPTESHTWQLADGAAAESFGSIFSPTGERRAQKQSFDACLLGIDGLYLVFEIHGQVTRLPKASLAKIAVRRALQLGRQRFWQLIPTMETLIEPPLDFEIHDQLEGEWEIVDGTYGGRSIVSSHPDRTARTVFFNGNQIHMPAFGYLGKPAEWVAMRYLVNSETKMMHRFQDGKDETVNISQPEEIVLNGDSLLMRSTGWKLKRIVDAEESGR